MEEHRPLDSPEMAQPTSVRLDDELDAAAKREAAAIGANFAEFVRTAVAIRVAWLQAVRAAQAGMDEETLKDPDALLVALQRAATRPDG